MGLRVLNTLPTNLIRIGVGGLSEGGEDFVPRFRKRADKPGPCKRTPAREENVHEVVCAKEVAILGFLVLQIRPSRTEK
jgi:hypothetical protein